MPEIFPMHHSMMRMLRNSKIRPRNMSSVLSDEATRESLERISLDIFADMTNAGSTFQQAIAAVYLSGLQHATELSKGHTE